MVIDSHEYMTRFEN